MRCVLLVEKHSVFRAALAKVLEWREDLGVRAIEAKSLSEARGRAAKFEDCLDVAVIELGLPDGDGVDLIRELRESEADVPILVLTRSTDHVSHKRTLEAGAERVLTKSSSLSAIIEALRQLSGREVYELDALG